MASTVRDMYWASIGELSHPRYTEEEVAALKERADAMIVVANSAYDTVLKVMKELREQQGTIVDVAQIAICELERAKQATIQYQQAKASTAAAQPQQGAAE